MANRKLSYEFLDYLVQAGPPGSGAVHLPSLNDLSKELGLSVSRLREQLEVARAMGLVEARPRTGMRLLPYSFSPAVKQSLSYAIALDRKNFEAYSDLRRQIEAAYWYLAVEQLTREDHETLRALLDDAWEKLRGTPIQIPQAEHRELHLLIYRRLDNPFVLGLLEAYWDAYEAVGLNVYADYYYLTQVWKYHERMVEAICEGDFEAGYNALLEHTDLIYHRPPHQAAITVNSKESISGV
ncbi:MAG TPA: FCD domain-containing protein [Anaerolineales bacterium]|nr:FCD domain-containing protein [Anaerolineales bacterium]